MARPDLLNGRGIGIDGCRAGWFAVRLDAEGWTGACFPTIGDVVEAWDDGNALMLIDIPIGLPDDTSCRACDAEARRYLGWPRASSVFNPPTRAALAARSWEEAADLNQGACGKRLSRQSWGIVPKIRNVDEWLRADRSRRARLREVHPEVLFAGLNGGQALAESKKTEKGRERRLALLASHDAGARGYFDRASGVLPRSVVQKDDILDAMCAGLIAARFGATLTTMPSAPPTDGAGLRCEIVLPSW